jgi:hypothetical protein
MTREELAAVIDEVLDAPRTVPGRRHTILLAVDHYTTEAVAAAFDRGYDTGAADTEEREAGLTQIAEAVKAGELQ